MCIPKQVFHGILMNKLVGNTIFYRVSTTEDESYGFEGSHGLKLISQISHYSTELVFFETCVENVTLSC